LDLIAIDDFVFSDWNIPPAMLTDKSSTLSFGANRRAGVYSSVFFSTSTSTASWHVIIQCPGIEARNALTAVLASPLDRELRLLVQRERYTDDLVTIGATVSSIQPKGSSDNLEVTFESGDSVWHAEAVETVTKSFTSSLDQAMHLPSPGNVPTYPIIRLTPTAQRTTQTADVGWTYRLRYTVTNNGDEPLFRYPVRISLGPTTGLVTDGLTLASGDDCRVWLDGVEQARTLVDWNTASSDIWVILPSLPVGATITYAIVFGNPEAGTPPVLEYPEVTAFALDDGTNESTNSYWFYGTYQEPARAGTGLWVLASPESGGTPDFTVPGAWRPALTFENPTNTDEYFQSPARHVLIAEFQTITASGTVSGGTYTITIPAAGQTTAAIAYNANAATIQTALEALSGINDGDILVTGGALPGTPVTLEYALNGQFSGQNVGQITINSASLTGGGSYVPATTATGDSWFQTTVLASRWRGDPFYANNAGFVSEYAGSYPYDGVTLYNPFGISQISCNGITFQNSAQTLTVVTTTVGDETASDEVMVPIDPVTRLVVVGRQSGGDDWYVIQQWTFEANPATSFGFDVTLPEPMKHVGISCWPYGRPSIPDDVEGGVLAYLYGDLYVIPDTSGKLVIAPVDADEIYELATELRLRGGANAVGPYSTLLVGNARSQSGAGTPRAAVVLGEQGLQIDTARHTHDIWDTAFLQKDEALSAHAVRGLSGYLRDGETGETRASRWLPLTPPRRTVANGDFAVDISSWELYDDGTGITYTATHDATIGGEQDGSLKIAITVNSGSDAVTYLNSQYFDSAGQESVSMSAWVRTSNASILPRLCIAWYASTDDAPISVSLDPGWASAPTINTGYTRTFAAAIPEGAAYFRIGITADTSASATGNTWHDDVRLNDNDLFFSDVSLGEVDVTVRVSPQWVP